MIARAPLVLSLIAALTCAACAHGTASTGSERSILDPPLDGRLKCELTAPAAVTLPSPIPITFKLTNTGPAALQILTWQTPLEPLLSAAFNVLHNGQSIPYRGDAASRGDPGQRSYVLLRPGEAAESTLDLNPAWSMEDPGLYKVEFQSLIHDLEATPQVRPNPKGHFHRARILCPPVFITVTAPPAAAH